MTHYWLLKTEPTSYSIDDLQKDNSTAWTGVRNYQARNFIRSMKKGDGVLIYHSSTNETGVYGVGKITKDAYPDPTAFNKKDYHYDPKSTKENPIWYAVDVKFIKKFKDPMTLFQIKNDEVLKNMMVAQRGSRLSVMPVDKDHFDLILKKSLR